MLKRPWEERRVALLASLASEHISQALSSAAFWDIDASVCVRRPCRVLRRPGGGPGGRGRRGSSSGDVTLSEAVACVVVAVGRSVVVCQLMSRLGRHVVWTRRHATPRSGRSECVHTVDEVVSDNAESAFDGVDKFEWNNISRRNRMCTRWQLIWILMSHVVMSQVMCIARRLAPTTSRCTVRWPLRHNYILTQFHVYVYIYLLQQVLSEFAPDSHSHMKPVRVPVIRVLY